jgi:hypothetical protein
MTSNKVFKPSDLPKKYTLKSRLRGYNLGSENFVFRRKIYAPDALNFQTLAKQFSTLHYLACHAPEPVQRKWKKAYDMFMKTHFGNYKASVRYLNKWSCHNWM